MGKLIDLTGKVFYYLTVIAFHHRDEHRCYHWLCRCKCGNLVVVAGNNLKKGTTKSCGCLQLEISRQVNTTHGMSRTKIHHVWRSMIDRCENPNNKQHDDYGGRGIKVCDRWHEFQNFYDDVSVLPHFGEKGYSLDRIENDKDYCPSNVRWVDAETQCRNRRSNIIVEYEGVEMTLAEAAEKSGINYNTLKNRYHKGDRGDRLFRPVKK